MASAKYSDNKSVDMAKELEAARMAVEASRLRAEQMERIEEQMRVRRGEAAERLDPGTPVYMQESTTPSMFTSTTKAVYMESPRTPLQRRRTIGDSASYRSVDQGGLWVHVEVDSQGMPKAYNTIEVSSDVDKWQYVGESDWRDIDRLPKVGLYLYLY